MHRFFSPQLTENANSVHITDPKEIHHLRDVLRLKAGSLVEVFNGRGIEAKGEIVEVKNESISIKILESKKKSARKIFITLACAIPKNAKFEFIIEKTTELGIDEIIPLETENTEVKIPSNKMTDRLKRFETIALNAAKQSKRTTIPTIYPQLKFEDVLKKFSSSEFLCLIPHLSEKKHTLSDVLRKHKDLSHIVIFIGPEGDFSKDEVSLALKCGCLPVTLGKNTLKVDTAAISVVSYFRLVDAFAT